MTATVAAAAAGALGGVALAECWAALDPRPGDDTRMGETVGRATRRPRRLSVPGGSSATWMAPVTLAVVGWSVGGLVGAIVAAAGAVVVARQADAMRRARRTRARERGVGPLARSIADGLRGGCSIRGAVRAAASDRAVPPALREAVAQLETALARGCSLPDGLEQLARGGGPQLTLLAASLALHAERGGALVRELAELADDADRAVQLDEDRAAATAQARATVRTVAALPLLALAGAQLLGGDFVGAVARHPAALALLVTGLTLEAVAVIVTRRLVARAA